MACIYVQKHQLFYIPQCTRKPQSHTKLQDSDCNPNSNIVSNITVVQVAKHVIQQQNHHQAL